MTLTRKLTWVAILVAVEIVLSRFLSIPTAIVKIGFAFLPTAWIGMLFGPWWAALAAAAADLIGATLFPIGAYFPGFTLTAALTGLTYGLILFNHPKSWLRVLLSAAIVTLFLNLVLDTLWLVLIGQSLHAIIVPRLMKSWVMLPIQTLTIYFTWSRLNPWIKRRFGE